ncbi:MAG: Nucleotide-binding protein 2 [Marteilia pararefringens]
MSSSSPISDASICAGKLNRVKNVFLVMSGKGGVGKSMVSFSIAKHLSQVEKHSVCLLDVDLNGPSLASMIRNFSGKDIIDEFPEQNHKDKISEKEIKPFKINSYLDALSIGFMIDKCQSVMLRGPAKTRLVEKFLDTCMLNDYDYLIIDTPPGTSDEHIAIVEHLKFYNPDGAILVTTPHALSVQDVQREVKFCRSSRLPITGIVENMSYFVCPCCSEKTHLFGSNGGKAISEKYKIPLLARIPLLSNSESSQETSRDHKSNTSSESSTKRLSAKQIFEEQISNICSSLVRET